jgi:hypothetical protein
MCSHETSMSRRHGRRTMSQSDTPSGVQNVMSVTPAKGLQMSVTPRRGLRHWNQRMKLSNHIMMILAILHTSFSVAAACTLHLKNGRSFEFKSFSVAETFKTTFQVKNTLKLRGHTLQETDREKSIEMCDKKIGVNKLCCVELFLACIKHQIQFVALMLGEEESRLQLRYLKTYYMTIRQWIQRFAPRFCYGDLVWYGGDKNTLYEVRRPVTGTCRSDQYYTRSILPERVSGLFTLRSGKKTVPC